MDRLNSSRAPTLLVVACITTVLAYWVGLQGPFLLDDEVNLSSIPDWLNGKLGLKTLLLERGAGAFGRAVSMGTFAFNSWVSGYTPFSLKLGNLIVHLLCGGMIYVFLRRLLRNDARLAERAPTIAAIVAALWLLHPLHASTVLYVVQRMAQLSTLFILLGLWLYLAIRERLQRGPSLAATLALLLGLPAITVIAFLAKENGVLLPLLCGLVELFWFSARPRPRPVYAFHLLYLILPGILGLVALAIRPSRFLGGYASRDFTLMERLLSQGRALCDYVWKLVAPNPPRMGVYTDDFAISTGLLSPPTTALSLLALIAITLAAWHWRKHFAAASFGWFFFLVAHSLEAGPVPLELYFEHRNYLPSVGLLLALVALTYYAGTILTKAGLRPGRIGVAVLIGVLVVLTAGVHGRARVWRDPLLIAESSLQAHPDSLRANSYVLAAAINYRDMERVESVLKALQSSPLQRNRSVGHAYRLYVDCVIDHKGNPADLAAFVAETPMPLTLAEYQPFNALYKFTGEKGCGPVDDEMIGSGLAQLADRAINQPAPWRIRYQAASFLLRARNWQAALTQAKLAWQPDADAPIATPLVLARLQLGDVDGAEHTYREAKDRADPTNVQEQAGLRWLRNEMDAIKSSIVRKEVDKSSTIN